MRFVMTKNNDAVSPVFLQSKFWAEFKASAGWTYARYDVGAPKEAGFEPFALSVLERSLGGGFRFAYVPHGPAARILPESRGACLAAIAESLRPTVSKSCAFIRFDPEWHEVEARAEHDDASAGHVPARPMFGKPLRKGSDVQPPDSVVLAIDRTDEELLAGMKPKWRYNVRLAAKKGVAVADEGIASLPDFYRLYQTTAARDRIAIHPLSYYERLLGQPAASAIEPAPDFRLWVARYEGEALAAIITVHYGMEATYLYGASSDEHRNLMPAYALQWAAIRAAREAGCSTYDFYGIPPVDDPGHAMSGLYRFKTGFGGEIRHYPGGWDYVLRPAVYAVFRAAERARLFWHKSVKKRIMRSR